MTTSPLITLTFTSTFNPASSFSATLQRAIRGEGSLAVTENLTIFSDAISLTSISNAHQVVVTPQSGTSDNLSTINAAVGTPGGTIVSISRASSSYNITVNDSSFGGNIRLGAGYNYLLSSSPLMLMYDGSGTWYDISSSQSIKVASASNFTIYCDSALGNDSTGSGASSSPFATLSKAFTYLESLSCYFSGSITVWLAAGSYDGAALGDGLMSKNRITIRGPSVSARTRPTAIISGSAGSASYGLFFQKYANVYVKDVEINGFSGYAESGIAGADWCDIYCENVWLIDSYYNINTRGWARIRFQGGCLIDDGYASVLCFDFSFVTIGYLSSGTVATMPTINPTIADRIWPSGVWSPGQFPCQSHGH